LFGDRSVTQQRYFDEERFVNPLRHVLAFRRDDQFFRLHDERILTESAAKADKFLYRFREGEPVIAGKVNGRRNLRRDTIDPNLSILAQRRHDVQDRVRRVLDEKP
jgi:hypothetical protein